MCHYVILVISTVGYVTFRIFHFYHKIKVPVIVVMYIDRDGWGRGFIYELSLQLPQKLVKT